jgi:type II secretory pathway component PulK
MIGKKSGAILITSLWILSILSILALGIGFRVSIEARLAKYNMDGAKALYLAKAGLNKVIYRLSKSPTAGGDTVYECGTLLTSEEKSDPDKLKSIFSGSLGEGVFDVSYRQDGEAYPGPSDEERRININTAPENVLKNIFVYAGEDGTIASSVVQWRTQGVGLDDGYYQALPSPYECKHQSFSATEELMLIKGINKAIFDKIKNYITIFGSSAAFTVNINTAPKAILSILLMADAALDKTSADLYADQIINFRDGPDGKAGTKDDIAFTPDISIETVLPALSSAQIAALKKHFTTTSNYFRIESHGLVSKAKVSKNIVGIVRKAQGKALSLKYYREY